jgi:hypothetical protein
MTVLYHPAVLTWTRNRGMTTNHLHKTMNMEIITFRPGVLSKLALHVVCVFFFGTLFYNTFSVTRLHSVGDNVTCEWWWTYEDKHPCLKWDSNPVSALKQSRPMHQTARPRGPAAWCQTLQKQMRKQHYTHNYCLPETCIMHWQQLISFHFMANNHKFLLLAIIA